MLVGSLMRQQGQPSYKKFFQECDSMKGQTNWYGIWESFKWSQEAGSKKNLEALGQRMNQWEKHQNLKYFFSHHLLWPFDLCLGLWLCLRVYLSLTLSLSHTYINVPRTWSGYIIKNVKRLWQATSDNHQNR